MIFLGDIIISVEKSKTSKGNMVIVLKGIKLYGGTWLLSFDGI